MAVSRDKILSLGINQNLKYIYETSEFSREESLNYKEKWANSRKEIFEKRKISERWRLLRSYRRKWGETLDKGGYDKYRPLWEEAFYKDFIKNKWKARALKRVQNKRNLKISRMCPKSRRRKEKG